MKKVLAMVVAVVAMAATGVAQKPKAKAAVSAVTAQASPQVVTATTGYVPVVTNSGGDLGDSMIFENLGTGNIGIGTATPLATLDVSGTNPTLRVDNYSNTVGDSPNFNFYSARGTAGSPGTTQAGDNLGQFAATGFNGSAFGGSKVKVTFEAADTWTTSDNGTAMSFQTTQNGSTSRATRLFIDNTGNVGIGSIFELPVNGGTAPAYPLTVNGVIDSMVGGFRFPDNTVQATAAVSGVVLTSPDSSITVGGTATAPTVEANTAVVQKRVAGSCTGGAITTVNADGSVACGTVGPGGTLGSTPLIVATKSFTGAYGNGTVQTVYTAPANGYYRVSVYMNVPTTGTCATAPCAGEAIVVQWNDGISSTALATGANCNLVTVCGSSGGVPLLYLASGQAITAQGQSYGTGSAPSGSPSYSAYVLVEQM